MAADRAAAARSGADSGWLLTWSSPTALGLVAIAAASGIGNLWRFPAPVAVSGGSALLLVYVGFLVLFGLPLLVAELAAGRLHGGDAFRASAAAPPALRRLGRIGAALAATVGVALMIVCLALGSRALAAIPDAASANAPLARHGGLALLVAGLALAGWPSARRGIERAVFLLLPATLAVLLALAAHTVLVAGHWEDTPARVLAWRLDRLDLHTVTLAAGYAVLSLAIGAGVMAGCGARAHPGTGLLRIGVAVVAVDTATGLLLHLTVFALLAAGGEAPATGTALIFESLPRALARGPAGALLHDLLYAFVALSALLCLLPLTDALARRLATIGGWRRRRAMLTVIAVGAGGALLLFGLPPAAVARVDGAVLYGLWPLAAALLALVLGWQRDGGALATALPGRPGWRRFVIGVLRVPLPLTLLAYTVLQLRA